MLADIHRDIWKFTSLVIKVPVQIFPEAKGQVILKAVQLTSLRDCERLVLFYVSYNSNEDDDDVVMLFGGGDDDDDRAAGGGDADTDSRLQSIAWQSTSYQAPDSQRVAGWRRRFTTTYNGQYRTGTEFPRLESWS